MITFVQGCAVRWRHRPIYHPVSGVEVYGLIEGHSEWTSYSELFSILDHAEDPELCRQKTEDLLYSDLSQESDNHAGR